MAAPPAVSTNASVPVALPGASRPGDRNRLLAKHVAEKKKSEGKTDDLISKMAKAPEAKPVQQKPKAVNLEPSSPVAAGEFPTDWMKPKNIMKYNIDADPMAMNIDTMEADVAS